jgi:hypothetical protein
MPIRSGNKAAKVKFGSGRKPGVPTGRKEGVVAHVIASKKAGKAAPGSQGPKGKFGYSGTPGASTPSSRVNMGPEMGPVPGTTAVPGGPDYGAQLLHGAQLAKLVSGNGSSPSRVTPRPEHWHRFGDGSIERGRRELGDDGECVHKLGGEHVSLGRKVSFQLPDMEEPEEGLVVDWGKKGLVVQDAEGEHQNVFWPEIVTIDAPRKSKRKNGDTEQKPTPGQKSIVGDIVNKLLEVTGRAGKRRT